ncbi:hypothetical protein Pmani_029534 [Petrolisthes manimaculis]|uniref:C2H2-type domain-containing protein n=1 Tax=Petrolisthes manimaculis TaxID=1843537 RepID=A0AAE1NZ55_9EUCA|nr:hypothetical protein Pmani_029534 [Petrolisthes manimaculis]
MVSTGDLTLGSDVTNEIMITDEDGLALSSRSGLALSSRSGLELSSRSGLALSSRSDLALSSRSGLALSSRSGLALSSRSGLALSSRSGLALSSRTAEGAQTSGGALGSSAGKDPGPGLEVVGRAVGAAVVTGPEGGVGGVGGGGVGGVDVCSGCSDLINDTDAATAHLAALTARLTALFHNNQRPKLTLQLLPRPAAGPQPQNAAPPRPPALNLDDLAATRSRRGRQPRRNQTPLKEEAGAGRVVGAGQPQVKKKGGRPRKPFGCPVCKRKFLTSECVRLHLSREHSTPAPAPAPPLAPSLAPTIPVVKEEKLDDLRPIAPASLGLHCPAPPLKSSSFKIENGASVGVGGGGGVKVRPGPTPPRDAASQVLATLRPIQPKPQAVVGTGADGSMVVLVTPGRPDAAPALLTLTPGYTTLTPPRPAPCHQCPKTFTHEKSRRMHTIAAHGLRKRRRGDPDGDGAGRGNGNNGEHGEQQIHNCMECGQTFNNKRTLGEHRRTQHGAITTTVGVGEETRGGGGVGGGGGIIGGAHACEECPLTFGYKYELERHRETHVPYTQTGPHEFVCRVCGLRVASKAALKIHLHRFHRRPDPPRTYLCCQCGCLAATKKAFSDHQRAHGTEPGPRARCQVCQKDMLASSYRVHLARMHGEARHTCQSCDAKFTVRSDLMRHLNTAHSTLRPYNCPICALSFTTSDALRYHRNKTHSTTSPSLPLPPHNPPQPTTPPHNKKLTPYSPHTDTTATRPTPQPPPPSFLIPQPSLPPPPHNNNNNLTPYSPHTDTTATRRTPRSSTRARAAASRTSGRGNSGHIYNAFTRTVGIATTVTTAHGVTRTDANCRPISRLNTSP